MTKQQTFDTVVKHLRKQKRKATHGSACRYRTDSGLKCAAGCLIPDDKYYRVAEGRAADSAPNAAILIEEGHDVPLVQSLQSVHDVHSLDQWEAALAGVAKDYGLTYSEAR